MSFQAPQGGNNTSNYSTLTITVPDGTTSVALKIIALNNDAAEFWNLDNVVLSGTSIAAVPEPGTWAAGLLVFGTLLLSQRRRVLNKRVRV